MHYAILFKKKKKKITDNRKYRFLTDKKKRFPQMSINSKRQCTKRVSKRKGREYVRKVSFSEAELFDLPFRSARSKPILSSWIICYTYLNH